VLSRLFSLWFQLRGWKIRGRFPKEIKKMVIAVGPHTSAWDFVIAVAAKRRIPVTHAHFLGKKELFRGLTGWFFRSMGGIPVDRSSRSGMVQDVAEKIRQTDCFRLGMSPEGTRKKVEKLKTGFYHIAREAHIPILLVGLDFSKREVLIGPLLHPSGSMEVDFRKIHLFFKNITGKNPKKGMGHLSD
jgi:1-acyl-sn-glycerol-3-phosphate acyltransferase